MLFFSKSFMFESDLLLITLQVINVIVVLAISFFIIREAKERKGRSLYRTYYILALASIILLCWQIVSFLELLPTEFRWDLLEQATFLIFILALLYCLKSMNKTIEGYEELQKIKEKRIIRDVE